MPSTTLLTGSDKPWMSLYCYLCSIISSVLLIHHCALIINKCSRKSYTWLCWMKSISVASPNGFVFCSVEGKYFVFEKVKMTYIKSLDVIHPQSLYKDVSCTFMWASWSLIILVSQSKYWASLSQHNHEINISLNVINSFWHDLNICGKYV